MNCVQLFLHVLQTLDHGNCYFREDFFGDPIAVDAIQRAAVHVLHAVVDCRIHKEGTVEPHNEGARAFVQDIKLHENLFQTMFRGIQANFLRAKHQHKPSNTQRVGSNYLHGHHQSTGLVKNTPNDSILTTSEVALNDELVNVDFETDAVQKFHAFAMNDRLAVQLQLTSSVAVEEADR